MANLSQEKRERMLAFLNKVKEEHKDDDETLIALDEIENELNSKKYGLVWEKHEEEVDRMMQDNIPVFTEVKEREIKATNENAYNFLLEGDNLHSLKLLEKTHAGKIDVIYIDPPYNTGNQDFIYDDSFVDKTDGYAHSKWLSFMSERLEIAKRLLSDDGVIFISIDDNEQAQLKLLCDSVFGEDNFVCLMPRVTKKAGKNHGNNISKNHDYIFAYMNNIHDIFNGIVPDAEKYPFRDEYFETRGSYKLNQTLDYSSLWYNPNMDFEISIDGQSFVPGGDFEKHIERHKGIHKSKDWVWRWSYPKIKFGLENDFIVVKNSRIYTKTYLNANIERQDGVYYIKQTNRSQKYSSLHFTNNEYSNDNAKKDLSQVFDNGNIFDFSKPISLIQTICEMTTDMSATVLDFFAGSGTTAQAVLELNKEDGGNRKFILCTNNENNICEEVTYERIKRVIHGYSYVKKKNGSATVNVEGIPANLKYFKTDFIAKDADDVSEDLLSHIKEMVELENGITLDNKHYLIVLSDEQADELAKNWANYEDVKAIYVSRNVLFTSEQNALFSNVEIHIIPDYYFEYELKEVGETW